MIGDCFRTNKGVLESDALSPKLFNFYLNEPFTRIANIVVHTGQNHTFRGTELPFDFEYADDIVFLMQNDNGHRTLVIFEKTRHQTAPFEYKIH